MGGTHQKVSPLDGVGRKREAELNDDGRNELKEVRDGIAGDVQGLSDEDESRINDGALDLNETHILEAAAVSHIPVLEKLKHQSSAPIVRWERFLPLRTLKVLLVENDDSTRQVVRALLRNCCYEVTAVENGLEAWRVLQDLTNHIDLVLTEVVMPGGSGIGLLYKIMSHKTCKTIPVIMMSSNDSMGVVFKCLSKGAVDFLVKPIRKNELKNLWQHVWRRCHSSSGSGSGSGSGSESGIQGQKFTMSKSEDDSDNNTGSNDDEDDASIGLSVRDGSDNGSGTQSSCTKRAFEANNPQQMSPSGQTAGPHYSTCAQVIHTRPEAFCSKKEPMIAGMDWKEQKTITDDFMGADPKNESNQTDIVSTKLTGPSTEKSLEILPNNIDVVRHTNYSMVNEPCARAPDRLDSSSINTDQQLVFGPADTSKNFLKISDIKDNGSIELPSLEPSLKKLRSKSIPLNDERNVLKHSNLSAFSRYPASAASVQAPTIYGGNSVLDNSSEATPQNQGSNGSSTNNNDNGSTNINVVSKPAIFASALSSAFHRVEAQSSTIQPNMTEMIGQSRGTQKQVQVQHHHHHYHHYHHHVHALPPQPDPDGFSVENLKENVAYCNSSNVFTTPAEMNAADYSLNDSNSRSNHGSDGQNGCSTAINTVGGNVENVAVAAAEKNGVGGGNGSGNGAYQNRFTQREAALNKFRQKRKERNFGKKVRYQSRKRLAEQRPRVRGQFVRRIIRNDDHEEDCSHLMLD